MRARYRLLSLDDRRSGQQYSVCKAGVFLCLLSGISWLFTAHAAREVDLVHRYRRWQALVLHTQRRREGM